MSKKSAFQLVLVAVIALGAGLALPKVWPVFFPEVQFEAALDTDCNLRAGPCVANFPQGGTVRFSINPNSIPVMETLKLSVDVEGVDASSVEVDFDGVDMYMGLNRAALSSAGQGQFKGQGILPVCVRNAMEWEAKVMVKTSGGLYVAPFRFITVKPGAIVPK